MSGSALRDLLTLPPNLPVPQDDGACDHLGSDRFKYLPAGLSLSCTDGTPRLLSRLHVDISGAVHAGAIVFAYPRTGVPGQAPGRGFSGEEWDDVPGARGCTPESCGFGARESDFRGLGFQVFGLSTSTTEHQRAFQERMHREMGFRLDHLSDASLALTRALRLATFAFPVESGGPTTLMKRCTLVCMPDESGRLAIAKVFYPVFPPDQHAQVVLAWLRGRASRLAALEQHARELAEEISGELSVRAMRATDRPLVEQTFTEHFGGTVISSRRQWIDTRELPGLVCEYRGQVAAVCAYTRAVAGHECELVALAATIPGLGAGKRLLKEVETIARSAACTRVLLTTSNDNVDAIRMYQLAGWTLAAAYPKALEEARRKKPQIPAHGPSGIAVRDDLEFEVRFA